MTDAYYNLRRFECLVTYPRYKELLLLFATLMFAAQAQAQFGIIGEDLELTIESRFLTNSDNFFERIGIDFDFNVAQSDTEYGFVDLNSNSLFMLDIPVSLAQTRLEAEGAVFPDRSVSDPVEIGGSSRFMTDSDFDTVARTSLSFDLGMGITAPSGTIGRIQNQGVVGLELSIPLSVTGDLQFEVETSFDADIVEPLLGKYGLGAFVELTPNISEFRFSGPSQRFFYDSESLGPFGGLYSTSDFTNDKGVLLFRGQNTIQIMIDPADLVSNQIFFQAYTETFLENLGLTLAQIDATQTASFTLRSLTPGVTFVKSGVVPEPSTIVLLMGAAFAVFVRRR